MKGCALRFYMHENQKHHGVMLHEWLLEQARREGIHGGSAFRAIAGFGRHGVLSEQHFFELAGQLTVVVEFVVAQAEADALLEIARKDGVALFYTRSALEFGHTGPQTSPVMA
jgi:PII-like signaling protein